MTSTSTSAGEVTQHLWAWSAGDLAARDALVPLIYDQLREMAKKRLRAERPDHTHQPTSLVHEVYLRLIAIDDVEIADRAQFFGLISQLMRRILVDHARRRNAIRRGGPERTLCLRDDDGAVADRSVDLLALHASLQRLAELDPAKVRLVELRFFGGLSLVEAATLLGRSRATIIRQWRMARTWLYADLRE